MRFTPSWENRILFWFLVKRCFGFFFQWTWKKRPRASFFKMGIKFPNLSRTKGCTLQSGWISGESHKEPTTEQEEGELLTQLFSSAVTAGEVLTENWDGPKHGRRSGTVQGAVQWSPLLIRASHCQLDAAYQHPCLQTGLWANFSQPFCTLVCYPLAMFYLCN